MGALTSSDRLPRSASLMDRLRFGSIVDEETGCWMWQRAINRRGYPVMNAKWLIGENSAHRVAYVAANGAIPDGMTVDHLCFRPSCVNPAHLQLLTHSENSARSRKAMSDFCLRGHRFTPENTKWQPDRRNPERGPHRLCRTCKKDYDRMHAQKRAAARAAARLAAK